MLIKLSEIIIGIRQIIVMGLWSVKWLVLWSLWAARLVRQPTVTLQLSNGPVRGAVAADGSHAQYLAIPYATVTQRFQSPAPEPKWEDVFEAVNENVRCQQNIPFSWLTIGSRNCLILNVYTPLNISPASKLPVMAFIHGGAFLWGSASIMLYGPEYLVPKGVILVTLNYRLNIQGFLCLGIKEAPGNAAMKDQVAALRWIQKNIREFGGDPDNVTIFGESAGGASVSYHLLSPMSKGLFHKAIMQSGSSLSPWAYQFRPVYLASLLAKVMLQETQEPYALYNYLTTKSDNELILSKVPRSKGNTFPSEVLFSPCTEKVIDGEEQFLTESPYDVLTKGAYNKVPVMIGTNIEEGLFMLGIDNDTMIPLITFEKSLGKNLHIPSEKSRQAIANELKRLYMNGEEISLKSSVKLSRWVGEQNFNYPSLEETELLLKTNNNPIYSYIFQYVGKRNLFKFLLPFYLKEAKGATHADDLFYLFAQRFAPRLFENQMIDRMSTMWTNFAKYGDPTPDFTNPTVKWHRVNSSAPTSLVIDSEFHTVPLWHNKRIKYLREIYSKFRRKR